MPLTHGTHFSLERRLPVLIGALLIALILTLLAFSYREVKSAALAAQTERLRRVTRQLAEMISRPSPAHLALYQHAADDPAVHALIETPNSSTLRARAAAALLRYRAPGDSVFPAELWDSTGTFLTRIDTIAPPVAEPMPARRTSVGT